MSEARLLKPKPGFNPEKLTWGRPDSPVSVLCSYCSASIGEDEIPLRLWNDKGFAIQFCARCMKEWWGME